MARFIDPRVDWAFKRIFGSEDTKECLITFLNGLFEDELVIKDVTFAKTEKLGLRPDDRGVVFDVYCVTNEGKHVIVEMQKKEQEYFADRALYYTARAIVQQGVRGIWDYHLAPVYTVCFMDFVSVSPMLKEFRTDLVLTDLQTRQRVSDRMRIVYLQLPLFDKHTEAECMDIFDCWIYIMKNMNMVYRWPNATYAVINPKDAYVPKVIAKKSIAIKEDIAVTLKKLLGKPADHIVSDTNFEPGRIY